jgi:restriction system protein
MPIPKTQNITLPLLKFASDGKEHHKQDATEHLANLFGLSEEERRQLLPSGHDIVFDNRVSWALKDMREAGILESTRRGFFHITQRGKEVLKHNPNELNVKFLEQFPEFMEFKRRRRKERISQTVTEISDLDLQAPGEAIEEAYQKIRNQLAGDLLDRVSIWEFQRQQFMN